MHQQTETNSVTDGDGISDEISCNIRQIPFPTGYFGSRQTLAFLLCASCFWCASSTSNLCFIKNPKCPMCGGDRITLIPISKVNKFERP